MMPKPTSDADATPLRVVIVTLDNHLASATERACRRLKRGLPSLTLSLHAATEWSDPEALARCRADIEQGDIIICTMLFMEDHVEAVLPWLKARREHCDAMIGCMSAGEIIRLTRLGKLSMDGSSGGALSLLKRLRGRNKKGSTAGAQQLAMLRRLPQILRFIPGTAQDLRAYFLTMQYWLAGSEANVANMVRFLASRYAAGPRAGLRGRFKATLPVVYPEVGLYHPGLPRRVTEDLADLPGGGSGDARRVGLLLMRSYVLAGDTRHYDGVIEALEARGIEVVPAFASGLDSRPAIERFFVAEDRPRIDAIVSLTGFSLVGGPAYNDSKAAEEALAALDVPLISAQALEFQTLDQWEASPRGLTPIEATMMVSLPELDGSTAPIVFGGRGHKADDPAPGQRDMQPHEERAGLLAARVARMIDLRRLPRADRKVGIVLFNFPPNGGSTGTAAHLSVFGSLHRVLQGLKLEGYSVDVPDTVDALRSRILEGNAKRFGTDANVHARIATDDHVRRETWLGEIEAQWGPAPGRQQSDGSSLFVMGERFGNVFVGIQPAFGYEGDPMRLLFEQGFAPTHAFSAFYRFLREDFAADAVLHFGTHGALEFMPGKQAGLSSACWPERLISDLPSFYLYAANNPSEGTIAKRRASATLISYRTPPLCHAGLYKGLLDLQDSLKRWRALTPQAAEERDSLAALIQTQAAALDLAPETPAWSGGSDREIAALQDSLRELEDSLIPTGLHVIGEAMTRGERIELLDAMMETATGTAADRLAVEALVDGAAPETVLAASGLPSNEETQALVKELAEVNRLLTEDYEIPAVLHALDGGFIRPVPGGDLLRTPAILPTGRNVHGFDPMRIPSAYAIADGAQQAERLLARHRAGGEDYPESIAFVLWGTDNLKSEGGPISQAMALMGARPRFDGFGRLCGAELIPLEDLGRPRIDVIATLSGIFRDLLPLQTRMLAEAAYLAATAEEPPERNFLRKHALSYQKAQGCDLEEAALRIFSNADGVYGSNVNHLIDSGCWEDEDELANTFTRRKGFAYGRDGKPEQRVELMNSLLADVELTYQSLESVELGVTTIDHYFDTLGGISRSVQRARGDTVPVYIGDQTSGTAKVRTLEEQVALETRTRMLNPKWYEGLLSHGHEGVRQIEAQVTNTMGWSATTGQVNPWVYQQITETFVLDEEMRERLAALNPTASAKVANRLLEAQERQYWSPDAAVLEALRKAGQDLEDKLEGVGQEAAA